ncbi:peptidogalycan biosysnthesis protein, partial [Streptomyces sp. 900105755]
AVALARHRGEDAVAAAAVFYHHQVGTTLYGRYWGAGGTAPPYSYFELTLYSAVDRCARTGMRRLHLSVPATPAKLFRGARATPLALVYLPARPDASLDPGLVQRHNCFTAQPRSSAPRYASRSWAQWTSPPGA